MTSRPLNSASIQLNYVHTPKNATIWLRLSTVKCAAIQNNLHTCEAQISSYSIGYMPPLFQV